MNLVKRVVAAPLIQFLLIGILVVLGYSAISRDAPDAPDAEGRKIVVTPGRIEHLQQAFLQTWQRPPDTRELKGLIDSFIKEEIYYREGLRMGLDKDDTVFRRRMQQKMEFLMEPEASSLTPTAEELADFYQAHKAQFNVPARISFEQITYNREAHSEMALEALVRHDLAALNAETAADAIGLGDPTVLPSQMRNAELQKVRQAFGPEFAETLLTVPAGPWAGPVSSPFGLHLVRNVMIEPAHLPALDEIRADVRLAWESGRRNAIAQEAYQRLLATYEIEIEPSEVPPSNVSASPLPSGAS